MQLDIWIKPVAAALLALPFLVTYLGLHFILFKPLLAYMGQREAVSKLARAEAEKLEDDVAERMAAVDERMKAAKAEVGVARNEAKARAAKAEAEILASARAASDTKIAAAVAEIEKEAAVASEALKNSASTLANDIATQVLGRAVQA